MVQCTVTIPKIWSDTLSEFTANQIPIHLIDLDTLRCVSRFDVARYYRPILATYLQKHPLQQNSSQRNVTHSVSKLVKYAIFSHRWLAEGEPTFQDMSTSVCMFANVMNKSDEAALAQTLASRVSDVPTHAGLHKLFSFCTKARSYDCHFAWSDTCCINKASSAELDESIRSMFRWYHNAHVCIVHLADSLILTDIPADEWFTRGWTLQELLAPEKIKFHNREWREFTEAMNDKDEQNPVLRMILAATNIPSNQLVHFNPGAFDVAQRLLWAAGRRTTRIEDVAYALVGIFGIHIPVQYGEGKFAFQRLMEALLQRVQGHGIFAWTGPSSQYSAALPASIEGYLAAREAEDTASVPNEFGDPSMVLTHRGLQVEVLLVGKMECKEADDDHSWREIALEEHSDQDEQSNEIDPGDLVAEIQDTHSPPDSENEEVDIGPLGNDEDYHPSDGDRLSCFHITDPNHIFKPLKIRGRVIPARRTLSGMKLGYTFAILDYYRDLGRGHGWASVPYPRKSKYLAFVLYGDHSRNVWCKLETDALVYVGLEDEQSYEGQTVNICL